MKKIRKLIYVMLLACGIIIAAPDAVKVLDTTFVVQAANEELKAPFISSLQASGSSSVTLKWNPVKDASGYRVYRRTDGNRWMALLTLPSRNSISYVDHEVKPGV